MIPFIRSLPELRALTEYRERTGYVNRKNKIYSSSLDSAQRKRYIKSVETKEIELPNLPNILRRKWIDKKDLVSRFIDTLDYNNQIQSSYDLTLLERQNNRDQQGAA